MAVWFLQCALGYLCALGHCCDGNQEEHRQKYKSLSHHKQNSFVRRSSGQALACALDKLPCNSTRRACHYCLVTMRLRKYSRSRERETLGKICQNSKSTSFAATRYTRT